MPRPDPLTEAQIHETLLFAADLMATATQSTVEKVLRDYRGRETQLICEGLELIESSTMAVG